MTAYVTPILSCSGISKRFGEVQANQAVSLELKAGKIHALLGENGAGKSTLLSILSGSYQPDCGEIRLNGAPVHFTKPAQALRAGVGIVHQRFLLVHELSIAENILLGLERSIARNYTPAKLTKLIDDYGFNLNLSQLAGELSMGEKQCVEILKLLVRKANILLFDEPTAVLPSPAIEVFFQTLNRLRSNGKAIAITSHKLDEVMLMADTITVMRRGAIVAAELDSQLISGPEELAELMVGGSIPSPISNAEHDKRANDRSDLLPVIEVSNFSAQFQDRYRAFKELNFSIKWGEIFAVVGVSGNGQEELADVLAGVNQAEIGTVRFQGRTYAAEDWKPSRSEVAYVPEDRYGMGTIAEMSLVENYLLTRQNMSGNGLLLDFNKARKRVMQGIESFSISGARPGTPAGKLSGGNLQKFLLFRELDQHAPLFIASNPTQGLDVLAAADIRNELQTLKQESAILLFTTNLDEALLLADSIAVMYRGRLTLAASQRQKRRDQAADSILRRHIGLLMAGVREDGSKLYATHDGYKKR